MSRDRNEQPPDCGAPPPDPAPRPDALRGSIAEQWADYERSVLPPDAPAVQRIETRRAFYAGCRSMFTLLQTMSVETEWDTLGDAQGVAYCEQLAAELEAFSEAVKAGKA